MIRLGVLVLALAADGSDAGTTCSDSLSRLYTLLGLPCSRALDAIVRADAQIANGGKRLMLLDVVTLTEKKLIECEGCRSPVRLGEAFAVVQADAISVVERKGDGWTLRRVVKLGNEKAVRLYAASADGLKLVALVGDKAPYEVMVADLVTGSFAKPQEAITVPRLVRPDQDVGDRRVVAIQVTPQAAWSIAIGQAPSGPWKQLAPSGSGDDGVDRFDPIWTAHGSLLYVSR
jgi:hypothetical protein